MKDNVISYTNLEEDEKAEVINKLKADGWNYASVIWKSNPYWGSPEVYEYKKFEKDGIYITLKNTHYLRKETVLK